MIKRLNNPLPVKEIIFSFLESFYQDRHKLERKFREKIREKTNSEKVILINNGRNALRSVLRSLDSASGTEIIVPSYICPIVPYCVKKEGYNVIFADINEELNIDTKKLEKKINPSTAAIISANLFGNPANMEKLSSICEENDILLIDDSCQSLGAKYRDKSPSSYADVSIYSFGLSKPLPLNRGGAITFDESSPLSDKLSKLSLQRNSLLERLKSFLKLFIFKIWYLSPIHISLRTSNDLETGPIKKFPKFELLLGLKSFEMLDRINQKRIRNAERIRSCVSSIENIESVYKKEPKKDRIFLRYPIRCSKNEKLFELLKKQKIDIVRMSAYDLRKNQEFNVASDLNQDSDNVIFLPSHSGIKESQVDQIWSKLSQSGEFTFDKGA